MKDRAPIRCFVSLRRMARRVAGVQTSWGMRYRTELIARGTGSVLYTSKPCDTEQEARALAEKYLAKNADRLVLT